MASFQMRKTEEGFCGICSEELRDPLGLPCLHGFCHECLEDWHKLSKSKNCIVCPACKTSTPIPQTGIQGFPRLVVVKSSKGTADGDDKQVKESQKVACSICKKRAHWHCVDCKKSLCQLCHTNHNAFMKDHKIVTVEELQSGRVTDEGRFCQQHDQQVRYFCETEQKQVCQDCVSFKTCPIEHDRISLKEAAKKQASSIEDLVEKCTSTKAKIQDAVQEAKRVLDDLAQSKMKAIAELDQMKIGYIQRIEKEIQKYKDEISKLEQDRVKETEDKLKIFKSDISKLEEVCEQGLEVSKSKCEYLITNKYPSLSRRLHLLSHTQAKMVDKELSYLQFESSIISTPFVGNLVKRKTWKLRRQFKTKGLTELECLAINQDGDVLVSDRYKGVYLYTEKGKFKCKCDSQGAMGVAFTPDNRYVVVPSGRAAKINFYDSHCNQLSSIPVTDVASEQSSVHSVAVDSNGRIICSNYEDKISIYHANGSLITRFATKFMSYRLAVTSNEEIVSSFLGPSAEHESKGLWLLDYSGCNARVIPPPEKVKVWDPSYVCCRKGEIFVVNRVDGDPTGVYRYTAEGDYLGCVTTEVSVPRGIALSEDGMELFVAESDGRVKIFQRE